MDKNMNIDLRRYPKEWLDYPSVTQVMPPADFKCTLEQLESARIEGTRNHARIERYLFQQSQGSKKENKSNYVQSFQRCLDRYKNELGPVVQSETPLLSLKHHFKGKPDIICQKGIIDLKRTFWDFKKHALQLAGYNILTAENKILKLTKNRFILVISDKFEEGYKLTNVYDPLSADIFLLLVEQWKNQNIINNYLN